MKRIYTDLCTLACTPTGLQLIDTVPGLSLAELVRANSLSATPDQLRAHIEEMAQSYERPQDVIAWYMGGQAKKEIAAGAPYPFEGKIKTGYILGKVFGILQIVGIVLAIAIYAIMIPLLLAQGNF